MAPSFSKNLGLGVLFALVAALSGISSAAQEAPRPVKLVTASAEAAQIERTFFGRVVARQTVDLAFQVGGQIVEFPVIEGETLAQGDLVASLDLETFEISLEQALARQAQADRTVSRFQELQGSAVSEVALEDALTEARLAALAVRSARQALDDAELHAPFDALVATRNVANFTTTSPGAPVVRLHDMSEVRIEIDVPEILFQRAGTDPDLTITATFPTGPEVFPLELREYNAETSAIGQTYRITLAMTRPTGLAILPGSSATVSTALSIGDAGIVVPASALVFDEGGEATVMVFTPAGAEEGTVARRDVTVEVTPSGAFRVGTGLADGEEIVAAAAANLEDGQTVRRFTGFPK